MSASHNMKTGKQKALLHFANTNKLRENSIHYKAAKMIILFKEIGLWPVVINQEQNKLLHILYRDISNLYFTDNITSAFFK